MSTIEDGGLTINVSMTDKGEKGDTGEVDISGKLNKSNDTLETYTEKVQATTGVINLSLANVFTDTPSASRTYSITNAKSGVAHSFTFIITMGATTVHTLTFPNSVKWQGGEIPDMSTANKTYVLTFMTVDGGATWLGMSSGKFEGKYKIASDDDFSGTSNGTFKYIGSHKYVIIPHVIKGVNVTSYRDMFRDNASTILKGIASDNPNITVMGSMFYNSLATTLDLSSFDTSSITNMWGMFAGSKATTLDLSSFDTSKVTDMGSMFYNSKATTLDLSSFDTSSVTNMRGMFSSSLATTLDLSNFNTSSVTDMGEMFAGSLATTGYARTQADADRFNASSGKPAGLTFVVK